jgi:hypothetical protein
MRPTTQTVASIILDLHTLATKTLEFELNLETLPHVCTKENVLTLPGNVECAIAV